MPRLALLLVLPLALIPGSHARPESPTKPADLVLVQKGTLPVIVSAPHGGKAAVPGVPERLGMGVKQFATVRDASTDRLAELFAAAIEKQLGGKPWVVVARFDRRYLDVNRPPDGAYESETAKPVYDAYHGALAAACKAVKEKHGAGLLLDVHGQGVFLNGICRGTRNGKTVTLLKQRHGWPAVVGKNSVLGRMEAAGYQVLPKGSAGEDAKEEPAFTGAHIVGTYGSHTGYGIDAIQLEFGLRLRDPDRIKAVAGDLADAVATFHDAYLKDGGK